MHNGMKHITSSSSSMTRCNTSRPDMTSHAELDSSSFRFGRKVAMLLSFFTVGVVGTTMAFVPNFGLYAPLRFLLGVGGMGIFMTCFLLGEISCIKAALMTMDRWISWLIYSRRLTVFGIYSVFWMSNVTYSLLHGNCV